MERAIVVRPEACGWAVIPGDGVAIATFRSPADAIVLGRDCARRSLCKLVIQAPDGDEHFAESFEAIQPVRA
jgi:hypothetical protein